MKFRAMYKYELAAAAGVSRRTFSRWLRTDHTDLQQLGYKPSMHLLPPACVKFLCEKYVIIL